MNKRTVVAIVAMLAMPALADQWVPGHMKKDGTWVNGYFKSNANSTKTDNYSSKGNVNPYTGERGSVDPYAPKKPSTYSTPTYEYKAPTYETPTKPKKYY